MSFHTEGSVFLGLKPWSFLTWFWLLCPAASGERETDTRALKADTFFLLSFYFRTQTYVRHLREPSPVLVVGFGPRELGLVGLPPSDPSLSISLTGSVVRLAKK